MDSRLDKYDNNSSMSRTSRNEELYKKINNGELDNFSVRSNATVLGEQAEEIDVEKIKKILDKRYNDTPKRKSIRVEPSEVESRIAFDDTKEYDINSVLEKAKDAKAETYEEMRAQKIHNTQFNILSNLNIPTEKNEEEKQKEDDLMELINTITINEIKQKEDDEDDEGLDLLDDLKGSDDTQVYGAMSEQIKSIAEVKKEEHQEEPVESKEPVKKEENSIDNSFYTHSLFKKKDFSDSSTDFLEEEKLGIGVKILIVLVVISFLIGLFLFLKSFIGF